MSDSRLWCDCAFDFHEAAILKKFDFILVTLYSDINVNGAKLMGARLSKEHLSVGR